VPLYHHLPSALSAATSSQLDLISSPISFPDPASTSSIKSAIALFPPDAAAVISFYYTRAAAYYLALHDQTLSLLAHVLHLDTASPPSLSAHALRSRADALLYFSNTLSAIASSPRYTGIQLAYSAKGCMQPHYDNPVNRSRSFAPPASTSAPPWDWRRYAAGTLPERVYPSTSPSALRALVPPTTDNEWLITLNTQGSCEYLLGAAEDVVLLGPGDVVFMDARNVRHGVRAVTERVGLVVWEGREERVREAEAEDDGEEGMAGLFAD
jgi:hypothetical protein